MCLPSNLSNYSYIWSKVKIPFVAINEGHADQILTRLSTDSPLACSFIRRGEQERESKREKCVEDKYDKFEAFFRYFCNLLNFPHSLTTAKQCNAKNSALASIFLLDWAHWLHCVSHKTREFSKQWNSFQRNFSEHSLHYKLFDFLSKRSTKKISQEHELLAVLPVSWKLFDIPGDSSLVQNIISLLLQTK